MRTRIAIVSLLFATLPCLAATPEELREAGPSGMEALLAQGGSGEALDRVCGIRDCAEIRLFWYTDLEAAKKQARAEGKPILSLRLLGRLDEEFSCANSRYFRTVYYRNREINSLLRERFVLHWRSVRPVPKVTIDFGDGNRLERTLTGNSIHYVLDSRGRLIEALPGLSGPETFLALLKDSERAAGAAARLSDANLVRWATARHVRQLNDRAERFLEEMRSVVAEPEPEPEAEPVVAEEPEPRDEEGLEPIPTARDPWALLASTPGVLTNRIYVGGLETGSKMAGEQSILVVLDMVSDDKLQDLAKLRRPRVHLDADSRAFLLRKHGVTDPAEAERLVDAFETTVALDEVINEYRTGPAILKKLSDPEERKGLELEALNEWIYKEVFRAPLSDPWMGLAPEDVYVALPATTRTAASKP
ncbi:MAG: hypothetical protein ACJ759_03280 [Thermoanaerobaculia bacterium]